MKTKFTLLGGAALLAFAGMGTATTVQAKETWGKGAPEFSDPDGNIKFKVRGRIMYDIGNIEQDLDTPDSGTDADLIQEGDKEYSYSRLRRARIGVEGQFDSKWKYKAEVTLLGRNRDELTTTTAGGNVTSATLSTASQVEWEDVYLEYLGSFGSLVIGNQKMGSPLEEATSSRFVAHMERSFMTGTFGFGRVLGVGAVFGGQTNWAVQAFVNTDSVNDTDLSISNEAAISDEPLSFLLHGHYAPWSEPTKVVHLGGTVRFRDSGGATAGNFRYRSRPETNIGDRVVDAGSGFLGNEDTFYGVEAATIMGPFWASGEYGVLQVENFAGNEAEFSSYNLQLGWFLTGESRGYKAKAGEFDRTVPNAPVAEGGMGAWELRARYDFIDLDDSYRTAAGVLTQVNGGEATSYTAGVNWSPAKNVRFMGEYVSTEVEEKGLNGGNGDVDAIQFRAQFDF